MSCRNDLNVRCLFAAAVQRAAEDSRVQSFEKVPESIEGYAVLYSLGLGSSLIDKKKMISNPYLQQQCGTTNRNTLKLTSLSWFRSAKLQKWVPMSN